MANELNSDGTLYNKCAKDTVAYLDSVTVSPVPPDTEQTWARIHKDSKNSLRELLI